MKQSAAAIFREAGVGILWLDAGSPLTPCDTFDRSGPSDQTLIRLRIVDHLDRGGVHTLGWTAPGSSTATVQYRRAEQIAQASALGVSLGTVLGHIAAHEMGHVLLKSSTHDSFGLMKAAYNNQDLVNMGQGRLLFTMEEARELRFRAESKIVQTACSSGLP